jgi:hypothetical protein
MALTITNHLIRSADTAYTDELGDGGGSVAWLPGRVLTQGRAVAIETAGGGQPDPGRWRPGGVRRRVLVPRGRLGRPVRPYGPAAVMQASEVPGTG